MDHNASETGECCSGEGMEKLVWLCLQKQRDHDRSSVFTGWLAMQSALSLSAKQANVAIIIPLP